MSLVDTQRERLNQESRLASELLSRLTSRDGDSQAVFDVVDELINAGLSPRSIVDELERQLSDIVLLVKLGQSEMYGCQSPRLLLELICARILLLANPSDDRGASAQPISSLPDDQL